MTYLKIGVWIGFFERFDGELEEAGRSLNVSVVGRVLLVDERDFALDFVVDVRDELLLFRLERVNQIVDVVGEILLEDFAVLLNEGRTDRSRENRFSASLVFVIIKLI